jgi:lipoprotein-anchoring transpeptidase ErfK/SrfK
MFRTIVRVGMLVAFLGATPAAWAAPSNRNPFADFFNLFQMQPVPREVVTFRGSYAPGTVVISTSQRRLYYVLAGNRAIRYGVGVGREGFSWSGTKTVTMKREWPDWRPPSQMLKRRPDLPRYMAGGPDNPLGARALYLGSSLYRIHGSNEPDTIGAAVSSGCIRMTNRDVMDLYDRVRVGTKVVVIR